METFIFIFSLIGTVSFAISGALRAIEHEMDMFGVVMLGMITAVGGGMLRDIIILGITPSIFNDPYTASVALATSLSVFAIMYFVKKKPSPKAIKVEELILLLVDTLGLSLFCVIAVDSVMQSGITNVGMLLFAGLITGTGGGLMRDICAGVVPIIFRKHIYAFACLVGALVIILTIGFVGRNLSLLFGFITIFTIRILAATFKLNFPKIKKTDASSK